MVLAASGGTGRPRGVAEKRVGGFEQAATENEKMLV